MKQVEKHIIKPTHPAWQELDELAFKSKNLYNKANYLIRQSFIKENKYLNYYAIEKELKNHECYRALPAKVSQQVLKKLHLNWCSFFEAIKIPGVSAKKDIRVAIANDPARPQGFIAISQPPP